MNAHHSCPLVCLEKAAANVEYSELHQPQHRECVSVTVHFLSSAGFPIECMIKFNKTKALSKIHTTY